MTLVIIVGHFDPRHPTSNREHPRIESDHPHSMIESDLFFSHRRFPSFLPFCIGCSKEPSPSSTLYIHTRRSNQMMHSRRAIWTHHSSNNDHMHACMYVCSERTDRLDYLSYLPSRYARTYVYVCQLFSFFSKQSDVKYVCKVDYRLFFFFVSNEGK